MMLCSSCENYQKNPVPNFPVSIDLNLAAEYPHFMLDNGYQTMVFNEPRFVHEYVGYAGIVVVCGMDHAYHAFDLCCPVCLNRDTVVEIDGLKAICPKCGGIATEQQMKKAPAKWIADNPDAYTLHGTRSFWLNSWISPWATWESTIVMFLRARGNSKLMQVVYNTRFGQLWEDRGDLEDEDSVMARREDYDAELPDGVLCLTCGVDTQDDRLEYEVVGHGHFGETWGIKKGIIMGRPDTDEVWEALDDVIDHRYTFKNGVGLKISVTFVDEGGHFTQEVRSRCRDRMGKRVFAIKGRGGESIPYTSVPKQQKIVVNGKAIGMCWTYEIGVDAGKQLIMDNLRVHKPGPKYCHFPRRDDYGAAYFKGLLSERLVYKEGKKNPWQWEKIPGHERNEALDCRDYANAACKALSPDFDALERKLRSLNGTENTTVATQKKPKKTVTKKKKSDAFDAW